MDTRVIVRHLGSGRENQVQEFPAAHFRQLTIGRDPSCEIRFDAEKEDLVSRQHARIELKQTDPPEVEITDLKSRNGTFVNKQRVLGSVRLSSGDVVQFGMGGPEFQFDLDPPPSGALRPTRAVDAGALGSTMPLTREAKSSSTVGRATVETMLAQSRRKTGVWIAAVLAIIAVAIFAIPGTRKLFTGKTGTGTTITSLTPKEIATNNMDGVVLFEVGWKLIDTESGHQVSQVYIPNNFKDKKGKAKVLIPRLGDVWLPVFAVIENQVEPILPTNTETHLRAIGGTAQTIS